MKLSEENAFGNKVAEFRFIKEELVENFKDDFLIKALDILSSHRLFFQESVKYFTDGAGQKTYTVESLQLLPNPKPGEKLRAEVYGTGFVVGEGLYTNLIYINWFQGSQITSIGIVATVTSYLKYDMQGNLQKNYERNKLILENAIIELKERVFRAEEGWFLNIGPTNYSIPTEDGNFIQNVYDEDTNIPENFEQIFGPLIYESPIDP